VEDGKNNSKDRLRQGFLYSNSTTREITGRIDKCDASNQEASDSQENNY
jgi:hypothetical protein